MTRESELDSEEVRHAVKFARKESLNTVQAAFGHLPQWTQVRSRLMAIFGREGLSRFWEMDEKTENRKRVKNNASQL